MIESSPQIQSDTPAPDIANQGSPTVSSLFKEHLNSVYGDDKDDDFGGGRFSFKMPPWKTPKEEDDMSVDIWGKGQFTYDVRMVAPQKANNSTR